MSDKGKVAVFWDYENCAPPLSSQGYSIVNRIRKIAHIFGHVTTFKTYLDMSVQPQHPRSISFRSELQSSGVSMIDCPHNGKKDVVDKMILVDMLAFAIDHHAPATVILVAGDRDYAYAMSTLRLRQYNVVLIVPSANIPESLVSQASVVIDWNYAILRKRSEGGTPPVRQPYPDLDEDILERLTREIQGSNGDPAITAHTHVAKPAPTETPRKDKVGSTLSRARSTTQFTQTVQDVDRDLGSEGSVADDHISTTNEVQDATYDPFARPRIMSPRLERNHDIAEPLPLIDFPPSPSPSAAFNLKSKTPLSHSRTISGGTPISYGNPLPQITVPAATFTSPTPTSGRSDTASALKSTNSGPVSYSFMMEDCILPSDHAAVMDAFGLDDEDEDDYSSNECANVSTKSPHLTEIEDDPSHTVNAVQSSFNEGQASFRDIGRSPPVNDTSLINEPSEILSQQSSSGPSFSDPNVTMHNVEIGSLSQVTPSVIRHNSDNHFSGYHAPPTESIEDRIRRLTSPQFLPLINQLLLARSRGNMKPRRCLIAGALLRYSTDVYKRAGVTNFWDYATQAGQAFLVELGGVEGDLWISLHPNLLKEETVNESVEDKIRRLTPPQFLSLVDQLLLARSKGVVKPGRSTIAIALLQSDKDAYKRAGVTKFKDYAALAEQASLVELGVLQGDAWIALHPNLFKEETIPKSLTPPTTHRSSSPEPQHNVDTSSPSVASPPYATTSDSNTASESVEDQTRRLTPPQFLPLIEQLLLERSKGVVRPGRSTIAIALLQSDKDAYERAGVTKFKNYAALAEQASLVELGVLQGDAWIALHPNLFKEETISQSLTTPTTYCSSSPEPQHNVDTSIPSVASPPYATTSDSNTASESVEDQIRRLTPPQFLLLIEQLLLERSKGVVKPGRSTIATALLQSDKDAYERAGVTKFKDYAALAEQASLVELGGLQGNAWIALHPNLFKEETIPKSLTPLTTHRSSSPEPEHNVHTSIPSVASPPYATTTNSNTASESVEDQTRRLTPPQFLPLIEQLLLERSKGVVKPGRSTIATALLQSDKDAYERAGVTKFKDYAALAEQASLVELGGLQGDAWIALHPNLFKEETIPESVTPPTTHRSRSPEPQHNVDISNPSVASPPYATTSDSNAASESVEDQTRRLTPPQFLPLIEQLLLERSKGVVKPGRSTIATALLQSNKDAYKRAGVTKFKDYAALAEQASLVELGGLQGDAWIALHPNLFKEETIPKSVTLPTTHRNSSPEPQHNVAAKAQILNPELPFAIRCRGIKPTGGKCEVFIRWSAVDGTSLCQAHIPKPSPSVAEWILSRTPWCWN